MFWINLKWNNSGHTFKGTIGIDDPVSKEGWMLLKYSILKETVVDGLPEPVVHKTLEEL